MVWVNFLDPFLITDAGLSPMAHRLIVRNQALESKEQLHNDLLQDIGVGRCWALGMAKMWPSFRGEKNDEHWR